MPPRIPAPIRANALSLSASSNPRLPLPAVPQWQRASYATPAGDDASAAEPTILGPSGVPEGDPLKLGRKAPQFHKSNRRKKMLAWLAKQPASFKWPGAKGVEANGFLTNPFDNPNQPFPLNPEFRSLPVLGEQAREDIWSRIVEKGESIKAVSAQFGVDQRRVAAVVRMKQVEKRWVAEVCTPFSLPSQFLRILWRWVCPEHTARRRSMMMYTNRLVYKTCNPWLQNNASEPL